MCLIRMNRCMVRLDVLLIPGMFGSIAFKCLLDGMGF